MEIQNIKNDPIEIFMIDDERIRSLYPELKGNFPGNLNFYVSDQHGKLRIENASLEMVSITKNNPWRKMVKLFNESLVNNMLLLLVPDRAYISVSNNPISNLLNKYVSGKTLVTTSFEFSILKRGAKLVPHTDSTNKVITLMMYFPTASQEGREDLGTLFHSFPNENESSMKILKTYIIIKKFNFYEDADELYRIPFSSEGIYGLLKGRIRTLCHQLNWKKMSCAVL